MHHQCEQEDSQNKPTRPRRCGVGGQACSVNLLVRIGGRKRRIKDMPKEYSQNILAMFFILFFPEYSLVHGWGEEYSTEYSYSFQNTKSMNNIVRKMTRAKLDGFTLEKRWHELLT